MAKWNPYSQIEASDFFDPWWMFGIDKGFDVVIGNPPYIDIKGLPPESVQKYFELFKTAENRINLYALFIEKNVSILCKDGILIFINPNSILINESYKKIRKYIVNGVEKIIKLPDSVFENATVETIILMTRLKSYNKNISGVYFSNDAKIDFSNLNFSTFLREDWKSDSESRFNIFTNPVTAFIVEKIETNTVQLENFVLTSLGITPYDKYKGHSRKLIENREFHSKKKLNKKYVPLISGRNIHPYYISNEIEEYLYYGDWLGAPREQKFFENHKIIVRQILAGKEQKIIAGYSEDPKYFTQIGFSLISKSNNDIELKFILALLNSKLISFYHRNKYLDVEKIVFQKILIANCKQMPIKITSNKKWFVVIVDKILAAKAVNPQADTSALERQIDNLVYRLYNLTWEEVKVIEPEFSVSRAEYEGLEV
jgi:hypothetical protein